MRFHVHLSIVDPKTDQYYPGVAVTVTLNADDTDAAIDRTCELLPDVAFDINEIEDAE